MSTPIPPGGGGGQPPQPPQLPPATPEPSSISEELLAPALSRIPQLLKQRAPAVITPRKAPEPRKPPPKFDSKKSESYVKDFRDIESYFCRLLTPKWQEITKDWGSYLNYRRNTRRRDEKWRADVNVPWPFLMTEVVTSVVTDLLTSGDPLVQAMNTHDRDREDVKAIAKHLDYSLRAPGSPDASFPIVADRIHRAVCIQGIQWGKVVYRKHVQKVRIHTDDEDRRHFLMAVRDAEEAVGVPAPSLSDMMAFERWRAQVNGTSRGVKVPPVPSPGVEEVTLFDGPAIELPSIFEMRFDPFIGDVQNQEHLFQRSVKTLDWGYQMEKRGILQKGATDAAANTDADGKRFSTWEQQVANYMGLNAADTGDPRLGKKCLEVFECFTPNREIKHAIILNREIVANTQPFEMPYWHGETPYFAVRNITAPRPAPTMMGISEYAQVRNIFREANTLRSLRLDAVLLAVLPVFLKKTTSGDVPDAIAKLRPGQIINVAALDQISQLIKNDPGILAGFREIPELKAEIEEVFGATPNVRGAAATVGRVSATESERRVAQALIRQKTRLMRYEGDYQRGIQQMLMVMYQFAKPEVQVRIGGDAPALQYDRHKLVDALRMGFQFRGASRVIDRAIIAQQSMQFISSFAQYMLPQEVRQAMRDVWENFGLPGADRVISPDGDSLIQVPVPSGVGSPAAQAGLQGQGGAGQDPAQALAGMLGGQVPGPSQPGAAQAPQGGGSGIVGPDGNPIA